MSCTSCGSINSNCTCSDNCPNKTSDITLFDGTFNTIEIPCDASLNDVLTLLESYTTNMVNELSEMTSVVISEPNCIGLTAGTYSTQQVVDAINTAICNIPYGLDFFVAEVAIGGSGFKNTATATIPSVPNAPGKTVALGGNNYPLGERVQDVLQYNYMSSNGDVVSTTGTYYIGNSSPATTAPASDFLMVNNETGVFTITKKGEYSLTMSMSIKPSPDNSAYWKTEGDQGRFDIGICAGGTNSSSMFVGASKNIVPNMDSSITLSAQCVVQLNETSQVIFRLLNLTGEDYAGGSYAFGDFIRVGIVKLRDL